MADYFNRYRCSVVPDYHLLGEMGGCVQTLRKCQVRCQVGLWRNYILMGVGSSLVRTSHLWLEQVCVYVITLQWDMI